MTIYNQRETGQSAELNNIVPVNGNARSKGWLDSFGENTVQDGDIRYSRKDSDAKDSEIERIKSKKRTNAKDRQMLRDAGEKLTKADFYKLYLAHKLDLRGNGNIDEQIESIKSDGFRGDGGFGQNVVPSSINNAERYSESERRAYLKDVGLSDTDIEESINDMRQNPGRGTWIGDNYFPRLNYTEYRYGGRAGDTILLVPEHFTDHAEKVTNGFKPFDYEVVTVEYDFQPYYELYSKAYDEAKGTRYSQELDSTGRQLSVGQQEYFKDSKIRDEDGNLLVVYHGSSEDFTIFDRTKSRANMDIQGSFFSPWEIDAGGYGENVRAFYLNITNPASEAEGYKALKKFQGQNNAGVKAREYLVSLGYDGVNNGNEEYIAFYPEQIKRTDNENPTEDVDIRKSRRSGETMSSLVEAAEANYRSERVHQEFLDAAKEWRNNATALNEAGSNGFNRRMTSLINEYGDNIDKKESDKLVGEIRSLTKSIMRNPDISYQEISDSAGAIAAKIMWGKKGTTDNLLFNEEAAMAVEDIKNDMLAQILNTTTRHQKIAKDFEEYRKQTQDRIEKIRDKRDARFEKMKAEAREAKERARERKHESEDRTKLLNVMRRLDTLAKKSDELTAAKVQELIGDYDLVAKSMTRGRVAQLTRLRDFVDYMFETDPDFMPTEKTVKLIQRLDQKRISDIKTVQEVRDLTEALLNLEHEIREHKRLIDTQYNQDIAALGDQMYEDVMATKGIGNGKVGVFNWFQQGLDKAIATPTIRPETEILRLVGFNRNSPLYQLTFGTENSLASGQRDMVLYQWNANRRYLDRKSTRLNSSHIATSRMPSSA